MVHNGQTGQNVAHSDDIEEKMQTNVPVIPHKAAPEVSKIGNYRKGKLLRCIKGRANPLMDHKVDGIVFF